MKRMHIHVSVDDLDTSIEFYSALFANSPDKVKPDYARWKLTEPAVNFAISSRGNRPGVDHLGIQVDDEEELQELRKQLGKAQVQTFAEGETVCCYAQSDKSWIQDPAGVPWEVYRSMADAAVFHAQETASKADCCAPQGQSSQCCG